MPVGHGLISCTAKTQHFMIHHPNNPGRRIVLVDTPGLDQTYVDDEVIFTDIAVWLAQSWVCSPDTCHGYSSLGRYRKGMKIAGIIYLHEICERRLSGASRKNLRQFHEFCGDDVLKNVILVTTKWDEVELDMGPQRERQLFNKYWRKMIAQWSQVARFMNTQDSAWAIVDLILNQDPIDPQLIQQMLVDLQKTFPEKGAGKTLRYTLKELLEPQKASPRQLQKDSEARGNDGLQLEHEETSNQLRSTFNQVQQLKVPLGKRILSFLSL